MSEEKRDDMLRTAWLSADALYRYSLHRGWNRATPEGTHVVWIMLNPSTADAAIDDPTIRRCIGFTKAWGHHNLEVVNVYALRSTNPKALWEHPDPAGPSNRWHLAQTLEVAALAGAPVVAAWGVHARQSDVDRLLALPHADRLQCLGTTKDGHPRHPLYVKGDTRLEAWTR